MRAMIYRRYGLPDVLELVELEKPTPKKNELLVKVCASSVSSADCRIRSETIPRGFGFL